MNSERGFGRRFLEILEHFGMSWEHAPTGIDSMSVILREEEMQGKERQVMDQVRHTLEPDRINLLHNLRDIANADRYAAVGSYDDFRKLAGRGDASKCSQS